MGRFLWVLGGLALAAFLIWRPAQPAVPAAIQTGAAPPPARHSKRPARPLGGDPIVYVAGAVARPGLYRLRSNARADDAVRDAGGLRADADAGAINLAARVSDGDEVFVPVLGSPTPHPSRRRAARQTTKKAPTQTIDVNDATAADLATVPGIGAALAARIVDVRERDGAFQSFDELLDVAGMTQSRLDRAEPFLTI